MFSIQERGEEMVRTEKMDANKKFGFYFISLVASIVILIKMLFQGDVNVFLPFLYAIYVFTTVMYIDRKIKSWVSLDSIFIILSFVYFPIKLLFIGTEFSLPFYSVDFYSPRFEITNDYLTIGFAYFLAGYLSFLLVYNFSNPKIIKTKSEPRYHLRRLFLVAIITVIAEFLFRKIFSVGVPGYQTATIPHAGYIFYPLMYGAILLSNLFFYESLRISSSKYIKLSATIILLRSFFMALLGWKSGVLYGLLYLISIYYYHRISSSDIKNKTFTPKGKIMIIVGLLIVVMIFPVITNYREYSSLNDNFSLNGLISSFSSTMLSTDLFDSIYQIVRRTQGLDNLAAIITYDLQNGINESVNVLDNIIDPTSLRPEIFHTFYVLGVDPRYVTQNAPTGWGALYIYGGAVGIIIGMGLFGWLSKIINKNFVSLTGKNGRRIILYVVFITNIFIPVIFEGTIIHHMRKNLTMLFFMYFVTIYILSPFITYRVRSYKS